MTGTYDLRAACDILLHEGVKVYFSRYIVLMFFLLNQMTVCTSAHGVLFGMASQCSESPIFEWREWTAPRTPECRTGRGDTTLASFIHFFFQKQFSFAQAASAVAIVVEEKMKEVGALSAAAAELAFRRINVLKEVTN